MNLASRFDHALRAPAKAPAPGLRRWGVVGLVVGLLAAFLAHLPARWMAGWVAEASQGHVLLAEPRGSVWDGSAELVLTGGAGSRDASRLPGRVHWRVGYAGGLVLNLRADCCSPGELPLRLQPGWGRFAIGLPARAEPLLRLPAAWLGGLGTPWNTLQLGGQLRLSAQDFQLEREKGRWQARGALTVDLANLSSRVSTLAPLGSYRFGLVAQPGQPMQMNLSTLEGALLLQGQGSVDANGAARFQGEAQAAPGRETALNNLLNIIGRRQGARSLISLG